MKYLEQIGKSLDLQCGAGEEACAYFQRVALSALSLWMQTAAFADSRGTSIVSLKRTAREKYALMRELTPEAFPDDGERIVDYIYDVLLENGAFLHRSNNVRPAPRQLIGTESFALVRGMLPEEEVALSGLAPFVNQAAQVTDWRDAFDLSPLRPAEVTQLLWRRSAPVPDDVHVDEYFNVERRIGQSFYRAVPSRSIAMQLGRSGPGPGRYSYYLQNGREKRGISENYCSVSLHEYVRLDLQSHVRHLSARADIDASGLVRLTLSELLPKPELRFLRYVAWPVDWNSLDSPWRFLLRREVWPLVRERIEFLNFEVSEYDESGRALCTPAAQG